MGSVMSIRKLRPLLIVLVASGALSCWLAAHYLASPSARTMERFRLLHSQIVDYQARAGTTGEVSLAELAEHRVLSPEDLDYMRQHKVVYQPWTDASPDNRPILVRRFRYSWVVMRKSGDVEVTDQQP